MKPNPSPVLAMAAAVEYQTSIMNPDGSVAKRNPFRKNLILDIGLDMVAGATWAACFAQCMVGSGTKPTRRDSGAITFSRALGVVTASANFFESGDAGRLLKFDSGEEMYVTGYVDPLTVNVGTSGTLAASEGTIYYVNETVHQTPLKVSSTYQTASGDNGVTFSVDTWTFKRTFIFSAESGTVTYREVGWRPSGGTTASVLFGRDVLPGGGDTLVTGQQYQIVVRLTVKFGPSSPVAYGNLGGAFDTSGNAQVECVAAGSDRTIGTVTSTGGSQSNSNQGLEPSIAPKGCCYMANFSLSAMTNGDSPHYTAASPATVIAVAGGYTPGTFSRSFTCSYSISQANGLIYGCGLASDFRSFTLKFTAPQTKLSTQTLTLSWRMTWQRVLTN